MHLHPMFHVSLLEPYASSSISYLMVRDPPPVFALDHGPEYEVKTILDSNILHNKLY